tara:strand:+ start:3603 stop:4025 length:423 start_codon:yes stop_codon:yes gene_type:complete
MLKGVAGLFSGIAGSFTTLSITQGAIISGTYTPTVTAGTNVAATTARLCQYMRVGNVVTVGGQCDIDPTAAGATNWTVSLPIASAFTTAFSCGGTGASTAASTGGVYVEAEPATDTAIFIFTAVSIANQTISFSFSYLII